MYKGGITRNTEGKREQFEFVADASTGTILELNAQMIETKKGGRQNDVLLYFIPYRFRFNSALSLYPFHPI